MYGRSEGRGEVLDQFSCISILWPQFQKWCRMLGHSEEQEAGPAGELKNSFRTPAHRNPTTTRVNAMTPTGQRIALWGEGRELFVCLVVLGYISWEKSHWRALGDPSNLSKDLDLRGYDVWGGYQPPRTLFVTIPLEGVVLGSSLRLILSPESVHIQRHYLL